MRKLISVSVVAAVGLVPAFALPQPTTGGSGFGCDTKGLQSDNRHTRSGSSATNPGVTTPSESPATTPQADAAGRYSPPPSTKPITKADCERARGTWEEMQMKCTLC
jgi:hypothetical protein